MNPDTTALDQAAFVAEMAKRQPGIGRTALMKYGYLLQTVKRVPLGFDFSLYAYGPYDTAVLNAIETAERWGAIEERRVNYPGGSGYEIFPLPGADELFRWGGEFLKQYHNELDWVVAEYKAFKAAGMELIATMVFADREALIEKRTVSKPELVETVLKIKPRFAQQQAEEIYDKLLNSGVLSAVERP